MKVYTLKKEQVISRPLEEVFSFFQTPENLSRITPKFLHFKILTPSPVKMEKGCTIDYALRIMGVPMRWTSLITTYKPPHLFVDEQTRGPYAFWHHTHRFEEIVGGTRVIDEVRYALPLGLLGQIWNYVCVRHQLNAIFNYRAGVIQKNFSS